MTLMLLSGPASEPVMLDEARAHLRLDATDENDLLNAFLVAARVALEARTRRAFVTQSWRLILDAWPQGPVFLPVAPVSAVTSVTLNDADGPRVVAATAYDIVLAGDRPRLSSLTAWPAPTRRIGGIYIDVTAGYGEAADVPAPLRQAIVMLAAHWFEHREPVSIGDGADELPLTVSALIAPYRRLHL
ncbi:MAG: head-tail connector protein [Parvibaculaceae bacterium]